MREMAKPCGILAERFACTASISDDVPEQQVKDTLHFLKGLGISDPVPDHCETKDFYSYLVRGILKPLNIQRARVTCLVSVKPAFTNFFGGFHGGAIAAVAEAVSVATARTVVAEDKELFLGELSISYLSSAPKNAEVIVDGICSSEWKKSYCNSTGVQAQENWELDLHCSCYLLSHACFEIMNLDVHYISIWVTSLCTSWLCLQHITNGGLWLNRLW